VLRVMGREVVVPVTSDRLDGSAERSMELTPRARRSLWHVGAHLLQGVRRALADAGVGQDHRGVEILRAIVRAMDCGPGGPQPTDGLCDKKAGAESQTLSPDLGFSVELAGSIELGSQPIDIDEACSASDAGRYV
jgi:hypothetical protein